MRRAVFLLAAFLMVLPASARPEEFPRVNAVVKAVRKSGSAVVNISTERVEKRVDPFYEFRRHFFQSPFEDFFDRHGTRTYTVTSLGSGVIVDDAGYIITNEHVIHGASRIMVSLPGNEVPCESTLISAIPEKDLALIKIDVDQPLKAIEMGNSADLMIGETVIALGNPFGLENTVTTGVISAKNRAVYSEGNLVFEGLIQTDAAINPGNSGGALLDINGRLIGINTAIKQKAEGIGFAIPVNEARQVLKDLLSLEKIRGLWLGAAVEDRDDDKVVIVAIEHESPAAKAGLEPGDIIEGVAGKKIGNCFDFHRELMRATGESTAVNLTVNGEPVMIALARYGENQVAGRCGLKGVALTRWMARRLRISLVEKGVLVTEVYRDSPAGDIGIEVGDVIIQFGAARVSKVEQLADELKSIRAGSQIKVFVVRGDQILTADMTVK